MARLEFQFRRLVRWPRRQTDPEARKSRPFKADFVKTVQLLARELHHVGAVNPVLIATAHSDRFIRIDGLPYADREPSFPGVVLEFVARPGRLTFAADSCQRWTHNLHAIALTLEWLRAVDRYGATGGGEQYAGFKALPPATTAERPAKVEDAAEFIASKGGGIPMAQVLRSADTMNACYRRAAKILHPDNGLTGNAEAFAKLQTFKRALEQHFAEGGRR
jgi:hypothetical protein